jgi:hypothetical protein
MTWPFKEKQVYSAQERSIPEQIYLKPAPCIHARKCARYEFIEPVAYERDHRYRVVHNGMVFEPPVQYERWGTQRLDSFYKLYEDCRKQMEEWVEYDMHCEDVELYYSIFGSPPPGAIGTREFNDMCWKLLREYGYKGEPE